MDKYNNSQNTYYKAKCTECGADTEVPFLPIEGKKLYCSECFRKSKR
jgi:CxxC-x17-CxxC domain-containing protein